MIFTNFRYIDPELAENGDGLTPATAFNDIPSNANLTDDCNYIIKKTARPDVTQIVSSPTGMTSNSNDEWEIIASSEYSANYKAFKAFNDVFSEEASYHSTEGYPHWLQWRNKIKKVLVKSYTIYPRYANSAAGNHNPLQWVLQGSDDGSEWTTLDTQNISWPNTYAGKKIFNVSNETSYYYHRIYATSGLDTYMTIGELRTYENQFGETFCNLPQCGSVQSNLTKIAFIGCPSENDPYYYDLPSEVRTLVDNAGWTSDAYDYAHIVASGVNIVQFSHSAMTHFIMRNINILRAAEYENFEVSQNDATSRWLFRFATTRMSLLEVEYCRFSAFGVNLDDDSYINRTPPMKCTGYITYIGANGLNSVRINHNIFNWLTRTQGEDRYCYDAVMMNGPTDNLSFCDNQCFMSTCNTTSYVSGATSTNNFRDRSLIVTSYNYPHGWIKASNNSLKIRVSDYSDLCRWMTFNRQSKIELIGNTITSGNHFGTYDFNRMKLRIFNSHLIDIGTEGSNNNMEEFEIKNLNVNIPEMWTMYGGHVLNFQNFNNTTGGGEGESAGSKKKIIENLIVELGEGPELNAINASDLSTLNSQSSTYSIQTAVAINGHQTWQNSTYPNYWQNGNLVKNVYISFPWGSAIYLRSVMLMGNVYLRGGIRTSSCSSAIIDQMSLKRTKGAIYHEDWSNIRIKELLIEDASNEGKAIAFGTTRFACNIDKSNMIALYNGPAINAGSHYNVSHVCQKDVTDNHYFFYKTLHYNIESCDAQRYGNNTLKIYGTKNINQGASKAFYITGRGNESLSRRTLQPGKYKIKVHCAFFGSDLVQNTLTSPADNNYNVFKSCFIILDTPYGCEKHQGDYSTPETDGWEWTYSLNPFVATFNIEIKEQSNIGLGLKFHTYSDGYDATSPTAAVFIDPNFEVIRIGDGSNSISQSTSLSSSSSSTE